MVGWMEVWMDGWMDGMADGLLDGLAASADSGVIESWINTQPLPDLWAFKV